MPSLAIGCWAQSVSLELDSIKNKTQERWIRLYTSTNNSYTSIPIANIDSICTYRDTNSKHIVTDIFTRTDCTSYTQTLTNVDSLYIIHSGPSQSEIVHTGLPMLKLDVPNVIQRGLATQGGLSEPQVITNNILNCNTLGMNIAGRGNTTWYVSDKKPYKISFNKKTSILNLPKQKKWILFSNPLDSSLLRNEVGFMLSRMSKIKWTPHTAYADVYLNNSYRGTYQISEKIGISDTRVNAGDNGFIIEVTPVNRVKEGDITFTTKLLNFVICDSNTDTDTCCYNYIKDYVNRCEQAIYNNSTWQANDGTTLTDLIDIDSFVDWYLINEIMKNADAIMYASVYMNKTKNGQLKMGPVWDFDLSLGNSLDDLPEYLESPYGIYIGIAPWFLSLINNDIFRKALLNRYKYFYNLKDELIKNIELKASEIELSAKANATKWAHKNSFQYHVKKMTNFLSERMDWLYDYWFNGEYDQTGSDGRARKVIKK